VTNFARGATEKVFILGDKAVQDISFFAVEGNLTGGLVYDIQTGNFSRLVPSQGADDKLLFFNNPYGNLGEDFHRFMIWFPLVYLAK